MKKKILVLMLLFVSVFGFSACGKNKINLADYIIEERETLYTANDDLYNISLTSGMREIDYNLDGVVNELTNFSILTLSRNDNKPLANDTYAYIVTINEETTTGFLSKNEIDNSYSTDLQISVPANANVNVKLSFTGYSFDQNLTNISNEFAVDKTTAINIANDQLKENIESLLNNNSGIEVVIKILKDYSSVEVKNYYWYVGAIANNGETLGILIDANTGEIIAKKV